MIIRQSMVGLSVVSGLAAALAGCAVDAPPAETKTHETNTEATQQSVTLATIEASPETTEKTGVRTWLLARVGVGDVEVRGIDGNGRHITALRTDSTIVGGKPQSVKVSVDREGTMEMSAEGTVLGNSLTETARGFLVRAHDDIDAYQKAHGEEAYDWACGLSIGVMVVGCFGGTIACMTAVGCPLGAAACVGGVGLSFFNCS